MRLLFYLLSARPPPPVPLGHSAPGTPRAGRAPRAPRRDRAGAGRTGREDRSGPDGPGRPERAGRAGKTGAGRTGRESRSGAAHPGSGPGPRRSAHRHPEADPARVHRGDEPAARARPYTPGGNDATVDAIPQGVISVRREYPRVLRRHHRAGRSRQPQLPGRR
ncbi:hypothetical protein DDQ41_09250 [Streptomyces spongiicola]|uniref:Uncharacterized protein n=1 Tax=Streptomyces spongiicola TaxID=1690221 RepID=A0ABM6V583_9ACTN|nr:hypothetical protein DDQ41_09250 [Streptomyces spongiicola]